MSDNSLQPVVTRAMELARKCNSQYVTLEHVGQALLEAEFGKTVEAGGIDVQSAIKDLETYSKQTASGPLLGKPHKTSSVDRVFNRAIMQVLFQNKEKPSQLDLVASILLEGEKKCFTAYVFLRYGIDKDLLTKMSKKTTSTESPEEALQILEEYCDNLTEEAASGKIQPVVGRDDVLFDLCQILGRKTKKNALLVGDPGVGKTAVAEGLALAIHKGDVPEHLKDAELWNLEIGSLLAGSRYRGDFEEKIKHIVQALKARPNAVLFVDEAHSMRGAGNSSAGGPDFANMIKPAISRGDMRLIASTTWEEFRQSFEKDRALMRRFQHITLDEPSADEAVLIMQGIKSHYETFYEAKVDDAALQAAVSYSVRYMTDKKLPDKALDLMDMAFARHKSLNHTGYTVTEDDILVQVSKITQIPAEELRVEDQNTTMDQLVDTINMNLFGQSHVVDPVLDQVMIAKAGLKDPQSPIGTFLFLGPTGVGKTEFAKLLAEGLHMKLHRFNMAEYMEKHTVSRLIGAPPGYVGHESGAGDGGLLIQAIQKTPHSVILFDEFEKAHPDVLQVLLGLMDEGQITGANGKEVDGRNTIVILTSNLGAEEATKQSIGFGRDVKGSDAVTKALEQFTKPEFRNRLDGIHTFNALNNDALKMIVAKFLNVLRSQLNERNITLTFTEQAVDKLIELGYDPKMGARPLQRTINKEIKTPLARKLVHEGLRDTEIEIEYNDGFKFNVRVQNNQDLTIQEEVPQ